MSTQTTTTQAASGAEGFVLVPKQATKAMLDAAYAAHDAYEAAETGGWGGLGSVYEAMVAAAPVTGTEEDHRELRAVMRRLSAAKNAGGIEDAEAQAQVLGHAVDACIGQIREFLATAPQPAGAERVDPDAERFRALMRCGRIKMQGSAGVHPDTGERTYPEQPGSVHFGAEFWVQPEAEPSNMTIWGRHCLRALADDILAFEAALATLTASQEQDGEVRS